MGLNQDEQEFTDLVITERTRLSKLSEEELMKNFDALFV
jgi:hypothetical protein